MCRWSRQRRLSGSVSGKYKSMVMLENFKAAAAARSVHTLNGQALKAHSHGAAVAVAAAAAMGTFRMYYETKRRDVKAKSVEVFHSTSTLFGESFLRQLLQRYSQRPLLVENLCCYHKERQMLH